MHEKHIDHVLELYSNRTSVDKEAYLASFEDIKANDYNLNIPRYIDTSEEEQEVDLHQLSESIRTTNKAIKEGNAALLEMLGDLTFSTPEAKDAVEEFISVLKEV